MVITSTEMDDRASTLIAVITPVPISRTIPIWASLYLSGSS